MAREAGMRNAQKVLFLRLHAPGPTSPPTEGCKDGSRLRGRERPTCPTAVSLRPARGSIQCSGAATEHTFAGTLVPLLGPLCPVAAPEGGGHNTLSAQGAGLFSRPSPSLQAGPREQRKWMGASRKARNCEYPQVLPLEPALGCGLEETSSTGPLTPFQLGGFCFLQCNSESSPWPQMTS